MDTRYIHQDNLPADKADLEFICQEARNQFKVELAYFSTANIEKQLRIISCAADEPETINSYETNLLQIVEGWVHEAQAPLLIPDTSQDPRFYLVEDGRFLSRSILSIPVISNERVLGILSLQTPVSYSFSTETIQKIHQFSRWAGKLLERNFQIKHSEILEKKLDTLSFIQRTVTSINNRDKLKTFVEEIVKKTLNIDNCSVILFNDKQEIEKTPKYIRKVLSRKNTAVTSHPAGDKTVVAPVAFQKQMLGYLELRGTDIEEYKDLGEILATLIGAAVQRLDISLEYESKGREYQALEAVAEYELTGAFTSSSDLPLILDAALEIIVDLLRVERVNIMLLEPETNTLKVQAYWGIDDKPFGLTKMQLGIGVAGHALEKGIPYQKQNMRDSVFIDSPTGQDEIKSLLAYPLMVEKRKIGVINIGSIYSDRVFSQREIKMVSLIASRVALAIENSMLIKDTRNNTRELNEKNLELTRKTRELTEKNLILTASSRQTKESEKLLKKISERQRLINTFVKEAAFAADPDTVLKKTVETLQKLISHPMTFVAFTLLEETQGRYRIRESAGNVGPCRRILEMNPAYLPDTISGILLDERKPLITDAVKQHPVLAELKALRDLNSFYAFPLHNEGLTFGVLVMGSTEENALKEEEKDTVETLVSLTSLAINNINTGNELHTRTEKLTVLNKLTWEIDTSPDTQIFFEKLVQVASKLIDHQFGVMLLYDQWNKLRWKASFNSKKSFAQYLTRVHVKEMLDEVVDRNIIYHSSADYDRFIKRYSLLKNLGVKSMVILPLKIKDHKIGVLLLGDESYKFHTRRMIEFYEIMAARLGLIVNNVLLFSEIILEKNRIESIIQCMDEGVISVDWERKIIDFNRAAEDITGWRRKDVIGKYCHSIFACRQAPVGKSCADVCPLLDILTSLEEETKGIRTEGKFLMKDNSERDLAITASLLTQGDDPVGGVLVFRDITEEKKFHSRRSDYLAAISHDIFTPLTAIKGYATTLLMHQDRFDAKTQSNFIKVINSEIDRVTRLLYNLMSLSRMETDRLQAVPQVQQIESHIDRIVSLYSLSSRNHTIVMDQSVKSVPTAYLDSDHLEQILNNLVSNAVKYSPAGGEITISAKEIDDRFIEISVRDRGLGIEQKDLDRIFEKYQRVIKKDSRSVSGMGLGLFITRVLVELNGGKIKAENHPEGGTVFSFTIPIFNPELLFDEEDEEDEE